VFFPVLENLGFLLILLVPMLTMRSFAEERARGTDELLLSTLLSPARIVGAKFCATFLFVALMMAASFVYPALAIREGGVGAEHLLAVFLGLFLHAVGLAALGLACSAFSTSQLVAAVAAFGAGFVLWDFSWASGFVGERALRLLEAIALHPRYSSFAEGVVIAADVAYFAGLALVCFATARVSFAVRQVAG
jgi:ABC-2 type transport system permease protein